MANASENPTIPTIGLITSPSADNTNILPTIGAVQENDTKTKVKAIKNDPKKPPLSTCLSALLTIQLGNTISNIPKKDAAKTINIKKKKIFGIQCVLNQLENSGPRVTDTTDPIAV